MLSIKRTILISIVVLFSELLQSQQISFEFEKTPINSGFKMEDYWIWCGSMIKVDSTYHLFASRWPKRKPFPEGYRTDSEIVRATSNSPFGPFKFEEVIIGERDSSFWDANMAHNPTIHKIGDEFVLFYIGSDFSTYREGSNSLLRRIGCAKAKSIYGPWLRCETPLINSESNNPAILVDKDKVLLIYRNADLRIYIAEADSYYGPYKIVNDNVWPNCKLEDFYLFKAYNTFHLICEDNVGGVSGHIRWGIHLYSNDGIKNWEKYLPVIVYDHEILFTNDSVLHCNRRERPQLLIENKSITFLINSIYDGKDSWSQPVKLKHPIQIQ